MVMTRCSSAKNSRASVSGKKSKSVLPSASVGSWMKDVRGGAIEMEEARGGVLDIDGVGKMLHEGQQQIACVSESRMGRPLRRDIPQKPGNARAIGRVDDGEVGVNRHPCPVFAHGLDLAVPTPFGQAAGQGVSQLARFRHDHVLAAEPKQLAPHVSQEVTGSGVGVTATTICIDEQNGIGAAGEPGRVEGWDHLRATGMRRRWTAGTCSGGRCSRQ